MVQHRRGAAEWGGASPHCAAPGGDKLQFDGASVSWLCVCFPGWMGASCSIPVLSISLSTCGLNNSRAGPSLASCNATYASEPWLSSSNFTFGQPPGAATADWQQVTIYVSGVYLISASGASGAYSPGGTYCPGATLSLSAFLSYGTRLFALVGAQGSEPDGRGAGGGTFLLSSDGTPLLVAGGGGAASTGHSPVGGCRL